MNKLPNCSEVQMEAIFLKL